MEMLQGDKDGEKEELCGSQLWDNDPDVYG